MLARSLASSNESIPPRGALEEVDDVGEMVNVVVGTVLADVGRFSEL